VCASGSCVLSPTACGGSVVTTAVPAGGSFDVGDMNGDGRLDLVASAGGANSITLSARDAQRLYTLTQTVPMTVGATSARPAAFLKRV